jgi:hypothetical protein
MADLCAWTDGESYVGEPRVLELRRCDSKRSAEAWIRVFDGDGEKPLADAVLPVLRLVSTLQDAGILPRGSAERLWPATQS